MGGLKEVDSNKQMAWTGGKPKLDWSGLDGKGPIRPTQFRGQGVQDVKSYTFRTQGIKLKLCKTVALESFCYEFWKYLKICGLDIITYVPDPADQLTMMSVVENHARF